MIDVFADKKHAGSLSYNKLSREFTFNYSADNPISLTMPYRQKSYLSQYHLYPEIVFHTVLQYREDIYHAIL